MTATLHTRLHSNNNNKQEIVTNNNSAKWKALACNAMQQMSLKNLSEGQAQWASRKRAERTHKKNIYMYI